MPFIFKAIDHIQLAAPKDSEDTARKFFKNILGFDEVEKPEELKKRGGVWFEFGNYQIHIGIEEPFYPAKKAHPAFEIENIEELKKHLVTNGIDVIEDDKLPGAKRFYISDPFGNRMELLEWIKE
ncbi:MULTISPECIES: VOC family protein [Peribacillus]|uniref:VOC family protein n=1 Tax=Peribacillus TaxID=2675229 RepID=UPI000BA4E8A2|nr:MULTISPECIES: VOC family protein [Peribacillus]MCK2021294.1 VOC family protein [Peribacillus frigoritolerans]PAK33681.1 glyoxalase [Peribacillus simplex]